MEMFNKELNAMHLSCDYMRRREIQWELHVLLQTLSDLLLYYNQHVN